MDNYAIEKIKKQYDFSNDEDILKLYSLVLSGQIKLDGANGRALDDEIYELAMAAKRRKALHSSEDIKQKKQTKQDKPRKKSSNEDSVNKQVQDVKKELKRPKKKVVVITRRELRIRRLLTLFFGSIAFVCFTYFGFYCYDAYQTRLENERMAALKANDTINSMYQKHEVRIEDEESGQSKVLTVLDEYNSLYNQNKNLIGWIKIADINNDKEKPVIDLPVMQTSQDNPTFYLDHNFDLAEDKNGALFMDAACDAVNRSTNLIIYGHNMRSGKMFGNLSKYKSDKFYKTHPIIEFDTIYEKGLYQVMYVFQSHIYSETEIAFKYYQFIDVASEKEFESNMNEMSQMSLYNTGIEASFGDQLLTLSTCDYEEKNGRFVVVAKRIQ